MLYKYANANGMIYGIHHSMSLSSCELTPVQEHYLKKELITLQLTREINKLSPTYNDTTGLRRFGPPFKMYDPKSPPPNLTTSQLNEISDSYIHHFNTQFPLLRFFFNEYLVTFPFIKSYLKSQSVDRQDEFWVKVQVFFEIWKTKNISNSNDRGEVSKRKLALFKLQTLLVMFFNSSIYCIGDETYFKTSDERNLYKKMDKMHIMEETDLNQPLDDDITSKYKYINGIDINVAGVVKGKEKKKAGFLFGSTESTFYLFIIRLKDEKTGNLWYIKRRYSDFVEFNKSIAKLYPGNNIPFLPSKNKNSIGIDVSNGDDENVNDNDNHDINSLQKNFMNSLKSVKSSDESIHIDEEEDDKLKFPRESLRVSLRGYLKALSSIKVIKNSPEFQNFITQDQINPTVEELKDIEMRSKLDYLMILQHYKFQQETIRIIKQLESSATDFKQEIYKDGGFAYIFKQLEYKTSIEELSLPVQSMIKLIQIEIASTSYEAFIGNDNARETFKLMKRLHGLFPYRLVSTILRFTNPLQMVKKLIDLFTYQVPIGFNKRAKSLLQVIFTGVLDDDLKKCNLELKLLKEKIGKLGSEYLSIVNKIDEYFACHDEDSILKIKKDSQYYKIDICLALLMNNNNLKIKLPNWLLLELIQQYKKRKQLNKEDTLYSLSFTYFKNVLRKRDKVSLRELWEEPELISIIKELLSIFFQPLINLFQKAELHVYIPIVQKYNNELVDLIQFYQNDYNNFNNSNIVASFISLQDKYKEYCYTFMRRLYLSDLNESDVDKRVFEGLINWFNLFIKFLNFVKLERVDLKIDLLELIKESKMGPTPVNFESLISELNDKIDKIEQKRKKFNNVDSKEIENDYLKTVRNDKLNDNWDRINDKFYSLLKDDNGQDVKINEMMGINDDDLLEMNMEFVELDDDDDENDGIEHQSSEEFLRRVNQGYVETDEEFKRIEELGQFKDTEINKLSDLFRDKLCIVIDEYKNSKG
ncbi:hypothetical protein CANARDRAFT_10199 [[Candida] arabinofermentans NRRL YB-2248]|uniref:PX domain-containing protein n=1 Tax=[Candida] arabinofermentans NRRL YB-2248 TaxID=983967 RepID=A0A1E4STJ2_9ASCO|nr:hypothetical protein CANARDRAFT_10199 [[Candida] arabinofermentans NRRL YB-2248]